MTPCLSPLCKMGNPGDNEAASVGRMSTVLRAGGTMAGAIGMLMPSLTSVLGPTEWMLRKAAGAASYYGYSKARADTKETLTRGVFGCNEFNVDGIDTSSSLAASVDNRLKAIKLAATDVDEMALGFLYSISSAIKTFTVSVNVDGRDSTLFHEALALSKLVDMNGTAPVRAMSTLAFVGNFFRYWRGNLKFRFRCARTPYHSARLLIGYLPSNEGVSALPPVGNVFDYQSVIWDIKTTPYIDFEVPFIRDRLWNRYSQDSGTIFVKVLDPLRCPANVSQMVSFIVEVSGGQDFQVAALGGQHVPVTYDPTLPVEASYPHNNIVSFPAVTAHAGQVPFNEVRGGDPEAESIGDSVGSLKSIFSMAGPAHGIITDSTDQGHVAVNYPLGLSTNNSWHHTAHQTMWHAYALWRGSWRLHAYALGGGTLWAAYPSTGSGPMGYKPKSNYSSALSKDAAHVNVPFYSNRSRLPTSAKSLGWNAVDAVDIKVTGSHDREMMLYCSMGDDFQLGMFRCTPWAPV